MELRTAALRLGIAVALVAAMLGASTAAVTATTADAGTFADSDLTVTPDCPEGEHPIPVDSDGDGDTDVILCMEVE